MKWHKVSLIEQQETGMDRLNNPIYSDVIICNSIARFTPITKNDEVLIQREITTQYFAICVREPYWKLKSVNRVKIGDDVFDVLEIKDIQRFTRFLIKKVADERL